MSDFDEDPLDLFDDDGDGVNEMCLLFDEDSKDKQSGSKPPGSNSRCCVIFLIAGTLITGTVFLFSKLII